MLNLNQLRAFYEVGKALSFSAAGENLFVSQPAVSKQVKGFEDFCDLKLLIRKQRKIYLTDEGKKVFIYASRIFELERQLEEVVNDLKNLRYGSVRIGTTQTYARWFMPTLLNLFQKKFPNMIIELDEGSSLEMTTSLLDFSNSLAIVGQVTKDPNVVFIPLLMEEIVLIAAPDHHLLKQSPIQCEDLKSEPMIIKEAGSATRKLVDEFFFREKIRPKIVAQTGNIEFIKQMVREKKAISFVVRGAVEQELSSGHLMCIALKSQKLLFEVCVAYLRDYELPHVTENFLEFVLSLTHSAKLPFGIKCFFEKAVETGKL